jgi:FixJ family two-component response regulator
MKEPCPMCGRAEDLHLDQIKKRERQNELMQAFLAGRKSERKFSRRENEVFDAFYDLEIQDFEIIAFNFRISKYTVEKYYDRAMEKFQAMLLDEL